MSEFIYSLLRLKLEGAMKLRLVLALSLLLLSPQGALAIPSSTTLVTADVSKSCEFSTELDPIETIGNTPGTYTIGDLGYTCNFQGSGATVTISSTGGTELVNPADTGGGVQYRVRWGLSPFVSLTAAGPGVAEIEAGVIPPGPPRTEVKGAVSIQYSSPLTVAGTYTDTIVFTISP